ncbi:sensor domain-containing protein [Calidifontibacillus oryziterrae]|uniref:sensor domain-containing protein n=1 Tax=Calidifontibacillus oryziterrae TaxID=1191699 RepID=UPI000301640A|nr:bifunctional diguanylate cyclase/phosphodiesterase [Calidifontibacillus oryziterrae]
MSSKATDFQTNNLWENNEILQKIIKQAPIAIIIIDLNGIVKMWNKEAEKIFGWTEDEVLERFYPLFSEKNQSKFRQAFRRVALAKKTVVFPETTRAKKDGSSVPVRIHNVPLVRNDNTVHELMITIEDLTDRKTEGIIKETINELENIKYSLDEASLLTITDPRGVIKYVNDHFCKLFQFSSEELVGFDHRVINSKYHPKQFFKKMWSDLGNGRIFRSEIRNKAKDGTIIWLDATIVPFIDENGRPYQYMSICKDITAKKNAEEELLYLAYYDELTSVANKRKMQDEVNVRINRGRPFALLCINLERFKSINDSFGYNIGDMVLVEVAKRLLGIIDKGYVVARKEGDKFLVLLNNNDVEKIKQTCEKILTELPKPFEIKNHRIYTSTSIGVCTYPSDGNSFDELLKKAVQAMYAAKSKRRNHYKLFDKQLEQELERKIVIERYLRDAIDNNELSVNYQPRIKTNSKTVVGMEALLRWNNSLLGKVPPSEFIPIAEETGLIVPIGIWTLEQAITQTKKWHELGHNKLKVSVNLSVIQLQEPNIGDTIIGIVKKLKFPPQLLELEITENNSLEKNFALLEQLNKLKTFGIQISIDDFGTGYSSLSYLRSFPVNRLKIDQSFVQDLEKNGDTTIVRTIIAMAKNLDFHVTAEGVETQKQFAFLHAHSCDEIQGFYFSRPLSPDRFQEFLEKNRS